MLEPLCQLAQDNGVPILALRAHVAIFGGFGATGDGVLCVLDVPSRDGLVCCSREMAPGSRIHMHGEVDPQDVVLCLRYPGRVVLETRTRGVDTSRGDARALCALLSDLGRAHRNAHLIVWRGGELTQLIVARGALGHLSASWANAPCLTDLLHRVGTRLCDVVVESLPYHGDVGVGARRLDAFVPDMLDNMIEAGAWPPDHTRR